MATQSKGAKFFLIVLVLALIAGAYYLGTHKGDEKSEDVIVKDIEAEIPAPKVDVTINSEKKTQKVSEKTYDIDIEYPVLSSPNAGTQVKAMNARISSYIAHAKSEFIEGATDNMLAGSEKSTLTIRYKVYAPAHGIETVAFDVSDYAAGAAHPNSFVGTLNFSVATGAELSLTDLCKDSSTCLSLLVPMYRESLKKELVKRGADYDSVAIDGSAPTADNYGVFIVTEESLDVVYNPYQVAAYAFGHVRTPVAWEKVAPFLAEAYH